MRARSASRRAARLGIVLLAAAMAFAAGWALRSAKDEGDSVTPKGAATLHEARGLAVPRLLSADPGPLRRPRRPRRPPRSPSPTSTGPTAVAPAPAVVAPLASPPSPAPAPRPSATPGGEQRFDSSGEEGSGSFDSER